MLRFSDRLTSVSSSPSEQAKSVDTDNGFSDEKTASLKGDTSSPKETEYVSLVEILGLHQTVKVLETEYSFVTGRDGQMTNKLGVKGYPFWQSYLT
jgi:hypothetical protein